MPEVNSMSEIDEMLIEDMAGFRHDPHGWVLYSFPWGEPNSELEGKTGPRKWQSELLEEMGEALRTGEMTVQQAIQFAVSSGHGIGKAQPYSLEIDTPVGRKRWGDIKTGDYLFGSNGHPTRVIARHEQGDRDIYRVSFSDGSSTLVDGDHAWSVKGRNQRRTGQGFIEKTTREILSCGVRRSNGRAIARQWEIPGYKPVEYSERNFLVDPYLMGVWLGDGSKHNGAITSADAEVFEQIKGMGYELGANRHSGSGDARTHTPIGLLTQLKKIGVFGCTTESCSVPSDYMISSASQRLSILQGLLDTDGWVEDSGTVSFGSISKTLAENVLWLFRSLGLVARNKGAKNKWYRDRHGRKVQGKPFYMVSATWDGSTRLFRLNRKQSLLSVPQHRYRKRWIDSIEFSHVERAMCVTVDAPDSLYLTSDFIVTHNSALVSWVILWAVSTFEDTKGVVTANTENQLKTKTWAEVAKWHRLSITAHWFKLTATALFSTDPKHEKTWRVDMVPWSERNTEAFAGLHNEGKRILLVFDEASAIPDMIWEVSEGALTDENTEIIWCAFGNPTRNGGRFHGCFNRFKHRWLCRQIDSRKVEGTNKVQIAKWIEDYGEDSDFARVRVRGLFPRISDTQIFSGESVTRAQERKLQPPEFAQYAKILSVDVARFGNDDTVLTLRQGPKVHFQNRYNGLRTTKVAAKVRDICGEHGDILAIPVDAPGVGAGVIDTLVAWKLPVVEVQPAATAPDSQNYVNLRAWMFDECAKWLETADLPDGDAVLFGEMTEINYGYDTKMRKIIESSKDIKERSGKSPDNTASLVLSFAPIDAVIRPALDQLHAARKRAGRGRNWGAHT